MTIKVKICGLKTFDAVRSAVQNGADYIGFVFHQASPRNIDPKMATGLKRHIPRNIKTVAVIVDASDDDIDVIFRNFMPDILQCHGKESIQRIRAIKEKYKMPVIKAIPVRSSDDITKSSAFEDAADMLLFDAKAPTSNMPGGNGLAFDWTLLKEREFSIPWFLSGGLNIQNVTNALNITKAQAVDVSSSLEREPGIKDPELISLFISKVKNHEK